MHNEGDEFQYYNIRLPANQQKPAIIQAELKEWDFSHLDSLGWRQAFTSDF